MHPVRQPFCSALVIRQASERSLFYWPPLALGRVFIVEKCTLFFSPMLSVWVWNVCSGTILRGVWENNRVVNTQGSPQSACFVPDVRWRALQGGKKPRPQTECRRGLVLCECLCKSLWLVICQRRVCLYCDKAQGSGLRKNNMICLLIHSVIYFFVFFVFFIVWSCVRFKSTCSTAFYTCWYIMLFTMFEFEVFVFNEIDF